MEFIKNCENLIDEELVKEFSKEFNLDDKIVKLLFCRGINTKEKIRKFLYDDISNLKNPYTLINMKETVARIERAIINNEKILIFGDYDVDGICASSLLYNYLKTKLENVYIYLPNRHEDGYGLSCPSIDKIAEKEKPNLIITVDCGISCDKEVEYIKNLGIDVIVTDHHELPKKLPNCLIVNTKFDQEFNFKGLCGAGVSFEIVRALCINNRENYEKYLPICAIATISDIVPLVDENRIIVKEGLKRLDLLPLGVQLLLKDVFGKYEKITSTDISFKLAPKINSAGRLDDANIALDLFITDDLKKINQSLKKLEYLNNKRKELFEKIFAECEKQIKDENKNDKIIVLKGKNWDIGVLGIVCARICEEYNKTAILCSDCGGILTGSARSTNNVDVVEVFEYASEYLIKFGGHKKAGGLSLEEKNFKAFKQKVNEFTKVKNIEELQVCKNYDLELDIKDISLDFVEKLDVLEPCGFENSSPIFKINFTNSKVSKMKNFDEHLIVEINGVNFLAFNSVKNYENYLNFNNKEALIELQINRFNNKKSVKGIIKADKFYNPNFNLLRDKLNALIIDEKICDFQSEYKPKRYNSLNQIKNNIDNKTLIVSYSSNFEKESIFDNFSRKSFRNNTNFAEKTFLYGLDSFDNLKAFNKIIFLDSVNLSFANYVRYKTNCDIYLPEKENFVKLDLNLNREALLNIYFVLVSAINRGINAKNEYDYYEYIKKTMNFNENYTQFHFAVKVFEELGIIDIKTQVGGNFALKINKVKCDLEKSRIYNIFKQ